MDRNSSQAALSLRPALLVLQCTGGRHSQILSFRPLRAYCEMRPHPARSELLAATPTAFHPRPRCASTLAFELLPRRSKLFTWGKAAGRFGHLVKCARITWLVSQPPQPQPQSIHRARGRPSDWNPGPRIASRTRILHRRHSPEKQRSQNGYGEGPEYSAPQQTQCSTVYFNFFTPSC